MQATGLCAQHGWPTFTVEQFKHMVGLTASRSWWSAFRRKMPARRSSWRPRWLNSLPGTTPTRRTKTAPYPGIPELLDELRAQGVQCAVFSNKADPLCGKIIAHYFGTGRFAAVRGNRPGVPTKPNPAGLYALMDEIGADRSATLFVGDSDVDILTGHNAGLPAMGALWGFRGRAELTAAGADALAAVPEDIFTYIQKG